jgi:hypothetical protein
MDGYFLFEISLGAQPMFGFEMLDVLIGLVTVYLTFGIACTAFVEAISSVAGLRARSLRDGLNEFYGYL